MLNKEKAQVDIEMGPVEKVEDKVNGESKESDQPSSFCKQWEILDGNFRFLLDGRIMYGPGICIYWWFIILHLIATLVIFLCFDVLPSLRNDMSEYYGIPIFLIGLSLFAIYNIVRVVFTDPGYIPRPQLKARGENLLNYFLHKKRGQPVLKKIIMDGIEKEFIFCEECCDFRDPRAYHCQYCNACIDRYDHHCGIFGTCIGRRNYGPFLRFLFATNFLFLLVGTTSLINLITYWRQSGFIVAFGKSPTIFVLSAALLMPPLGIIQLFFLMIRHSYLLVVDQTAYENKMKKKVRVEEEQQNWSTIFKARLINAYNLIVRAPPKSLIDPRSVVKMEDSKFLSTIQRKHQERKTRTIFSCPKTGEDAGDLSTTGENKKGPGIRALLSEKIRNANRVSFLTMGRNSAGSGGSRVVPESPRRSLSRRGRRAVEIV